MSWDSTHRWIVGAVGWGDVSTAIGLESLDEGTLCQSDLINPFALWKPFRGSQKGFASVEDHLAAIKEARCGFKTNTSDGEGLPIIYPMRDGSGLNIPHNQWVYLRPRGKGGGDNGEDEIYRNNDFSPVGSTINTGGYYADAVIPIGVMFPSGGITSGNNTVVFQFDENSYGFNQGRWKRNFCMAFDDMVPSNHYGSYHFGLIFQSSRGTSLVVSSTTVNGAASTKSATINFVASEVNAIPTTAGSQVACAMCLVPPSTNPGVYNGSTAFASYVISLELAANCDRTILTYRGNGSIAGMSGNVTACNYTKTTVVYTGIGKKFTLDLLSIALSAGSAWGGLQGVNLEVTINGGSAILIGDSNGTPYGPSKTYTYSLPLQANDVNRAFTLEQRGVEGFGDCFYLQQTAGTGTVTISMKAVHGLEEVTLTPYTLTLTY